MYFRGNASAFFDKGPFSLSLSFSLVSFFASPPLRAQGDATLGWMVGEEEGESNRRSECSNNKNSSGRGDDVMMFARSEEEEGENRCGVV